jgi:hypothetical protein
MANERIVTGCFEIAIARSVRIQSVCSRGFTTSDINLALSEETRKRHFGGSSGTTTELGNKAAAALELGRYRWHCGSHRGPRSPP